MSRVPRRIIYCSRDSRAQHEAMGFYPEHGCVLENGFDTARFSFSAEERAKTRAHLKLDVNEIVVGNVARFDVAKGHSDLLEAFAQAASKVKALKLVLIGRGIVQSNREITSLLERLGISHRVLLLGEQESLETIYPAFDIYCSSSLNEGFPNAISEAMACEIPCVVTDTGASKQLVQDIGIVVRRGRPLELSGAMVRFADMSRNERTALGQKLRERIVQKHSLDSAADCYSEMYRQSILETGSGVHSHTA